MSVATLGRFEESGLIYYYYNTSVSSPPLGSKLVRRDRLKSCQLIVYGVEASDPHRLFFSFHS